METTYFVTTPTYPVSEYVEHMLAQVYDASDWLEVKAPTRREAVRLAVKEWFAESYTRGNGNYVQRQKDDGLCPWTGIRAQSEAEAKAEALAAGPPDWEPDICDVSDGHDGAIEWVWVDSHPDPDLRWGWFGTCEAHKGRSSSGE